MNNVGEGASAAAVSLPAGVIDSQLARILASSYFADAPRLKRFLEYIVTESIAGNDGRLKGYSIGLEVFERPEDFDPQIDTIVRVQAVQLRRRLDLYYSEGGRDDPLRIHVPKGSYIPKFQLMLDPDAAEPSDLPSTGEGGQTAQRPSIAVVPFDNFGSDASDQYFADGLTEEVTANLARFKDLFVFSRSTTTKLTRDGADIRQLHDELGADFVVEGSVRKAPDRVRVTVQLIDAATDGHILAEQFERPCTTEGVFEIQDEIALLISGRIADRYGPLGRYVTRAHRPGRSKNWETHYWITRFYDNYAAHIPEKHLEVREGLAEALKQDPESSDGWAALAAVLLDEYRFHFNERPGFPALDTALEYARRAVACDPENAFAYQFLASAHFHRREFTDFRVAAERALKLNVGHADVLAEMGHYHCVQGDWERGLPLMDRAIELSPVHPGWYHMARSCYQLMKGDPQSAIIELREAPMPGFYWYHALLACFYAEMGDAHRAAGQIAELAAVYPNFAERANDEAQIWCLYEALAAKLSTGWRKAGLAIA
ncbi:MAG: hypothetical protein JXQ99_05120 [Hyphomicrobiaceae bacterium]